jgi:hypothetical protein
MNTKNIMSVVGGLLSAIFLTSCVVDVPVGGGHGPQGPVYNQGGGPPPPGYGYPQRPYGRPTTPPNNYGDVAGSRVVGFPPPGGYDPNFNYGTGGYRQR